MFLYRVLWYNYVMLTNKMYFLNYCFVFYMFRTSYVHRQEDYIVHAALYGKIIHAFKQAVCHVKGCALFFPLFGVYAITHLEILLYHLRRPTYLGQAHSRNYLRCKRSKNYTNMYMHIHITTALYNSCSKKPFSYLINGMSKLLVSLNICATEYAG